MCALHRLGDDRDQVLAQDVQPHFLSQGRAQRFYKSSNTVDILQPRGSESARRRREMS
jgi:hypothetical protein